MASDTLDLIGRLNDAFKSVAVCHCGNGIIDGCCDNHTPSWNPCPDSQLLHDAMNRLTALEAALKAADELIRCIDAYPPEISCTNPAVRAFHTDAKYMAAAWIAATDASRRAEKSPNAAESAKESP